MATPQGIPEKASYKSSEVCQYTDTQPYVLRFWESEFPQLRPERPRGGQAVYTRRDVELVMRIKQLLHEEEVTLADARRRLEEELERAAPAEPAPAAPAPVAAAGPAASAPAEQREPRPPSAAAVRGNGDAAPRAGGPGFGTVSRERYEDAVDEIAHLRLQLKEAEAHLRRVEQAARASESAAERERGRAELAVERLRQVLEIVS